MNNMLAPLVLTALLSPMRGNAEHAAAAEPPKAYSALSGQVVIDNDRVVASRYVLQPGHTTGSHLHTSPEVIVYVKGGVLKSESTGRSVLWREARVVWVPPASSADDAQTNIGTSPIEFVVVVLKPFAALVPSARRYEHLTYPNIPTEDLFENERIIVQRFQMKPGQWEGVHAHPPNTLYVFVKGGSGGHWVSKTTNPPSRVVGYSPDGDVGWMAPVDISAGHQSGNVGTSSSDVIWIALKDP